MTNIRLPRAVCAVVSEVLRGSHATLDSLFETAGAPGPPPSLPHSTKWKDWLFRAGVDPNVDSLAVLGNVLEEFMDIGPQEDSESFEHWKTNRDRVVRVLEENGFRYYRGGRVLPRNLLGAWKKRNAEILSCFDLERLQERMQAYADLEMGASVMQELSEASNQHRDADAVAAVWFKVYNESFITLYDRGLLANLIVVDAIPEAAQAQLDAMAAEVEAYNHVEPVAEVVAPVVQIDLVTQCARDFHEMGSSQFAAKYLKNTRNRPTYDAACERGLL
jgi:hypothetical protein